MFVELFGVNAEARQILRYFEKVFTARHLEADKGWSILCVCTLEVCSGTGVHATGTTDYQHWPTVPCRPVIHESSIGTA